MKFWTREMHYGLHYARVNRREIVTIGFRRKFKQSNERDWESSKKLSDVIYCFCCFTPIRGVVALFTVI